MDNTEARELAKAYADVAAYYPVLRMADNVTAMLNFGSVVAIVYGSKLTAWKFRRGLEKMATKSSAQAQTRHDAALHATPPAQAPGSAPQEKPRVVPDDVRKGEIPGVGTIEFPADHPLMGGRKLQ